MLYIGNEKKGNSEVRTEQELGTTRCTALCTCTLNCMYVCFLLLVTLNCYYELLIFIYMKYNIETCVTVNELWKR